MLFYRMVRFARVNHGTSDAKGDIELHDAFTIDAHYSAQVEILRSYHAHEREYERLYWPELEGAFLNEAREPVAEGPLRHVTDLRPDLGWGEPRLGTGSKESKDSEFIGHISATDCRFKGIGHLNWLPSSEPASPCRCKRPPPSSGSTATRHPNVRSTRRCGISNDLHIGQVSHVLRPWLRRQSPLMVAAVTSDWAEPLAGIPGEGVEAIPRAARPQQCRANVVDFFAERDKRRRKQRAAPSRRLCFPMSRFETPGCSNVPGARARTIPTARDSTRPRNPFIEEPSMPENDVEDNSITSLNGAPSWQ
jgi:hypothetical protein